MAGSLTKVGIGKEDFTVQTDELYPTTFTRVSSTGSNLTLTKCPDIWKTHQAAINARFYNSGALTDTTISTGCANIGTSSQGCLYLEPGTWAISDDLDLSSYANVFFKLAPGALLQPSAGKSVTIFSPGNIIAAPNQQIIDTTYNSTDPLIFSQGGIMYPDWWQFNTTPGTTNMTTAMQNVAAAISSAGGELKLLGTTYYVNGASPITGNKKVKISGQGRSSIILNAGATYAFTAGSTYLQIYYSDFTILGSGGSAGGIHHNDTHQCHFSNMMFGDNGYALAIATYLQEARTHLFVNCQWRYNTTAISMDQAHSTRIINSRIENNTTGITASNTDTTVVTNSEINANTTGIWIKDGEPFIISNCHIESNDITLGVDSNTYPEHPIIENCYFTVGHIINTYSLLPIIRNNRYHTSEVLLDNVGRNKVIFYGNTNYYEEPGTTAEPKSTINNLIPAEKRIENLCFGGSFEEAWPSTPYTTNTWLYGQKLSLGTGDTVAWTQEADVPTADDDLGSYSLKTNVTVNGAASDGSGPTVFFKAKTGNYYSVGFSYKNIGANAVDFTIRRSAGVYYAATHSLTVSATWTRLTYRFKAVADETIQLWWRLDAVDTFFLDAVKIYEGLDSRVEDFYSRKKIIVARTDSSLDLSGAASDIVVFHAESESYRVLKLTLLYTEASSADAGVTVRVGKESDDNYFYTGTSEQSKSQWYSTIVTPLQVDLDAGDTLTFGTAGGKAGTGEVMLIAEVTPF